MADIAGSAGVARGLIHHYIGSKRDVYLECVRFLVTVPPVDDVNLPTGTHDERVAGAVHWLVGVIEAHGRAWVRIASGTGVDPEVSEILDRADELAAERVLASVGFDGTRKERELTVSVIRAYGGFVKAAGHEWLIRGSLTRDDVERLLVAALSTCLVTARDLRR
ncbi:TetR/AcrR family transcriptional regulator [Rhodococcus sp. NBC_00297]|uniref:TetR/AcrR family transcriptional regulator n=1 Tax=Rhodococcus sp. NBC_00297 TaxID=2976005 RepID=UPI002E2B8BC7|nr:TetR/AcrR family transcriptional regulator [Rhodococcus sp. NBC_00297]